MTSQDAQEPRDRGAVGCKHEVFLSYSRKQRNFVDQLNTDLRNCGYSPFFDRDWYSLPFAENTTDKIRTAIEQCEVGIVVLSEDFFSLTKWPMFELAYMVKCKTRIMPVFYGISPADLDDVDKRNRWLSEWEKWADKHEKEHPEKENPVRIPEWREALDSLGPTQGVVYDATQGKVKLRAEIVKEINSRVSLFPDYSDVQGGARLCQIICEKISNTHVSQVYGKQVVGLHGVGGIGKTTSCKYLCKHYYKELDGRVCHIEFDSVKSKKGRLQELLKELLKLKSEVSNDWSEELCYEKLKKGLQSQRIFLAIDNVLDETLIYKETKDYIRLGAGNSIVLVTARSHMMITKELKIHDCIPMPDLEKHEARALFLQEFDNAPSNEVDEELLNQCIERCYFAKGKNGSSHYHPLALKVLGGQLQSKDHSKWRLQLQAEEPFIGLQEQADPLFSILRSSFDSLNDVKPYIKLLFLDVVLFSNAADYGLDIYDYDNHYGDWNIFKWLSAVHDLSMDEVQNGLGHLKRKSLLEDLGDGTRRVGVHDLWRDFAAMEANAGETESRPWLYEIWKSGGLESKLHYGGWEKLQRISIMGDTTRSTSEKSIDFRNCPKVTVLKLVSASVEGSALNLGLLSRLISLRIEYSFDEYIVQGIKSLGNLKVLLWSIIGSLPSTSNITFPPKLQVLRLTCHDQRFEHEENATYETYSARPTLDLGGLRSLEEARIDFSGKVHISGLSSEMTKLRVLNLGGCYSWLPSLPGLGDIIGMTALILCDCETLKMLPSLQMLTKLRTLVIKGCNSLEAVPGLGSLVALEELDANGCYSLRELPDVSNLTKLRTLILRSCKSLTVVLGLGSLVALESLHAQGCASLRELPDVSNLTKLRTLNLRDCKSLTAVPGLGSLVALESLWLWRCESLRELPNLSNLTKLWKLYFGSCKSLTAVPGLGSLVALKTLDAEGCESLRELPDVSSLTKLRIFYIGGCKSLTAVPGLGSLVALASLEADGCESLREVPDVSNLTNLQKLYLQDCKSLTAVPGLGSLVALEELDAAGCQSLREVPDVSNLTNLQTLGLKDCKLLTEVPGLRSLVALNVLVLRGCESLREVPDVSNLTKLRTLNLWGCKSLTAVPGLGSLVALEVLYAEGCVNLREVPDVSHLTNLQILTLDGCKSLTAVPDLGSLVALEELWLGGCESLCQVPDVSNLTNLRTLNLWGCKSLTAVPGLGSLVALEELWLGGCESLPEVPDLSSLTELRILHLENWKSLTAVPDLGSLVALKEIWLTGCESLSEVPDVSNLTVLQKLSLHDCKSLTAVPGLGSLVALEELWLGGCESLCEVPDVSHLTNLQILTLDGCKSLTAVPDLGSLVALEELWLGGCESLCEVPDVSNLTILRTLNLRGCKSLTAVPDLGSLVALKEIWLTGCESLSEVPDVSNLTVLQKLSLHDCKSLTAVPGLGSLVALDELSLGGCESLREVPDVSNLTLLQKLSLHDCKSLTAVPGLGSLVALEKLWLGGCESLCEVLDVSNLTNLRTLNLRGCKSLTAVPGLGSLVALEELWLAGCESLREVPDVSNLTKLGILNLRG